ncbi:hypothetical protein GQ44DRAFT_730050 [Phaeosphaeriaceae sp. PMI808]|nr:hypothetical protein GQ44DRAFT_730050 [Phaeosphaeriaceae sp. PMI808]
MDKLREDLGDRPTPMVIMLQGLHHLSPKAIYEHWWIRKNFKLSSVQAPRPCFTIIMVFQHIRTETWFRVSFPSERDAIGVEITISILKENPNASEKYKAGRCGVALSLHTGLWESGGLQSRRKSDD